MNCELKTKVISAKYDSSYVTTINSNARYVSDGIADDFKSWIATSPVLISAQTGSGKNHFIENKVLSHVLDKNLKLLILSNRIAVSVQQKKRIAKKTGCEKYSEIYTSKGFEQETQYGPVTIMTYQGFCEQLCSNNFLFKSFDYVVLDEAHFFMSDALFNSKTGMLLEQIPKFFSRSIRIYLTATPEEVLPETVNVEQQNTVQYRTNLILSDICYFHPPELLLYKFKRDYRYIQAFYFSTRDEILQKIKSDTSKNKWLVFVRSIDDGTYFLENLSSSSKFIHANTRSNSENAETWESISESGTFNQKVLITTSVLDNGVSISDDLVKNIVIFSYDRTEFLQMLGRKRVVLNEKVNLFIHVPSNRLVSSDLGQARENLKLIKLCNYNYPLFLSKFVLSGDKRIQKFFYLDKNDVFRPNNLALKKLNYRIKQLDHWQDGDTVSILKEILGWINQKYDKKGWINSKDLIKQELLVLLQSFEGEEMDEKHFKSFAQSYKKLRTEVFGKHPNDRSDRENWNTTTVKNRLKTDHLGYDLEVKQGTVILIKL